MSVLRGSSNDLSVPGRHPTLFTLELPPWAAHLLVNTSALLPLKVGTELASLRIPAALQVLTQTEKLTQTRSGLATKNHQSSLEQYLVHNFATLLGTRISFQLGIILAITTLYLCPVDTFFFAVAFS